MSAHGFIAEIFSRVQTGVAGNMRFLTKAQFDRIVQEIGQDPECGSVKNGLNGGLVWMPSGRWKYVLAHEPGSKCDRYAITKLGAPAETRAGSLFG